VIDEERQLWRVGDLECVMISCCAGAELQVRRPTGIVLREMYPTKSDLYERASDLKAEYDQMEPRFLLQTGKRR
jgi:hypothetical protein